MCDLGAAAVSPREAEPDVAGGGVAYFAHVGGFVFGLAPIKLFAQRQLGSRRPLFAH